MSQSEAEQKNDSLENLTGDLKEFYDFHGVQLFGWGFPGKKQLLESLHNKLKQQKFDAGEFFQILDNGEEEQYQVKALKDQKQYENVFLIDHAITFRYEELRPALEKNEVLLGRLQNMVKYWNQKLKIPGVSPEDKTFKECVEYDFQDIEDPNSKKIPLNCQALSLYGNNIQDIELVKQQLAKLPDLKVLWLNDNPIAENPELLKLVEGEYPNIEILNSKYTKNAGVYALKFTTFGASKLDLVQTIEPQQVKFLDVSDRDILKREDQTIFSEFPNLVEMNIKETEIKELSDINRFFEILKNCKKIEYINVDTEVELMMFELEKQGKLREICPSLKYVNGHDLKLQLKPHINEEIIRDVMTNIWKIVGCYRLASSDQYDESGIWYVNDEFGSSIQHSDTANLQCIPFLFAPNNKLDEKAISYSICWPIKDIKENDFITRDYLMGITELQQRSSKLITWFDLPTKFFEDEYQKENNKRLKQKEIGDQIIKEFNDQPQKLEQLDKQFKVISDLPVVIDNVKTKNFEFVDDLKKSDIIWLSTPLQDTFDLITKDQKVNQFPLEACITMKHELNNTVIQNIGKVNWLQTTYNLQTQLATFIGDYLHRKDNHLNNIWIIKPPNMARSMDMVVTDNLQTIIRLMETGPKLIQKYIERPLTIKGKKLDFRYIIVLKSLKPLDVYLYKKFWVRTSNNTFTNDYRTREVYDTHFTVMNYGKKLEQIHDNEFLEIFEKEYGDQIKWDTIDQRIQNMVKELFIAVQKGYPKMQDDRCVSIYGLDVMIDLNDFQPKMLEVTFSPDCNRACKYTPSFFEDIFALLFLNKSPQETNHIRL
ncbi:hypothetical protein PPERSA_08095 [Pseudocohnilembus persalinus]|uniref:Tubulin--tyrosine ligase-like protein 12 SET-like domain-containing protein n=1 Tax=Pseudocohnilembus persalinus TaxID=266149 RepID=A0A0V0R387_PSEPJ|nr:hypothetical protein PPERSA_08095 [Pseudocohnilembus persalinus]|eukprot:KRX08784.1 hypothetical protein PPERSA_08095 [Pseudocohnilembus persalinus]